MRHQDGVAPINSEPSPIHHHTPEHWKAIGVDMADRILEHVRQFDGSGQLQVLEACRKRLRQRDPHFVAVFFGHPQRSMERGNSRAGALAGRSVASATSYNRSIMSDPVFTHTPPQLQAILVELQRLEPIFHTPEFGQSCADYERRMASGYWEIGASGKRYSREFILKSFEGKPPAFAATLGWESRDHALQPLGADTYLLTYVLDQDNRVTRRATIWQSTPVGWQILYHQGTVVAAENEDPPPSV